MRTDKLLRGIVPLVVWLLTPSVDAQLAITEILPAPRNNTNINFRGGDYFELTNFGTNDVSLHGYGFRDSDAEMDLLTNMFANVTIRAGESIVFCRVDPEKRSVSNLAQFRDWWGAANLPASFQCRFWDQPPGLSGWDGDEVWLFDGNDNVVEHVQFSRAREGRAFAYAPETGLFGVISSEGVDGAFEAVRAEDIGSPGRTVGPVPVRILQQPVDQTFDAGAEAALFAVGAGMPPPRYQWFHQNAPIAGATSATLVIANVQLADAGTYQVYLSNGLSDATSAVAIVTINTNPTPPVIVSAPKDAVVFAGQDGIFTVKARGLPAPRYQWQQNGQDITGATGPTLEIRNVTPALSGRRYSVRVWNELGTTNLSAVLTVVRRPDLRFTEVMALPSRQEDNRHFDWFEVTNFDTNAVNLFGWRFSDEPSFARAITIRSNITLQPRACIVFAERLDRRLFSAWWGSNSLPHDLEVCTYSGFGLGAFGEVLYLWNPGATDPQDYVATALWARATAGVTFECTHKCLSELDCVDDADVESVPGVRGAFRAADGGQIGSPGYIASPIVQILSIRRGATDDVAIVCRVVDGKAYRLRRASSLSMPQWGPLQVQAATSNVLTLTDRPPGTQTMWFYRVEEIP